MHKIVTMGDSHSQLFANVPQFKRGIWNDTNLEKYFDVRWLGPVTFWRLCRDKKDFIDFDTDIRHCPHIGMEVTTKIEENQNIILCFGEIDIRYHILKQNKNYKQTIDDMIIEFYNYMKAYVNKYKIHICSIIPPMSSKLSEEQIPFIGTDEERRDVTIYFNQKLEDISKKLNFGFFDLTPLYSNDDKMLSVDKSDNIVHAIKTIELEDKIKQYFKIV
jgi:hypothetical protein